LTINADAKLTPEQWKEHLLEAKKFHKYAKLYIGAFVSATILADLSVILAGGNYFDLSDNNKIIYGTFTISALIKGSSTILPKFRQWALDKIKAEGKELEGMDDAEAKEIGENLHKITVLAANDQENFKHQIQSIWPLFAAVAAGGFSSPYNYLSTSLAAITSIGYVANNWYQIARSARKADKLFTKLENEQQPA
jgi:hypothetical protein